ncbi:hypothetical protein [Hyphomicrobium sp.]|uniref:hypothetical protein n=1 Tax=Hyphomicrobium sp. TaxID=82 RepID=UPI002E35DFE5|nr:hypothetical protein [Hyphomicrobium sp.]HEX2839683.1 hypothetical protein [Hyphomicrobium sp.]
MALHFRSLATLSTVLGLATLHLITAAEAGGSDPQIVLDEIYGQVAEMCSADGGPPYDFTAIAKTYFTPELAKKVVKASNDNKLDFDVLIDGNDCKVTELDLRVVEEKAGTAIGRAEFKNFDEERTVDLLMSKAGNEWQVTDIVYRHRPFSLKAAF